MDSTLFQYCQKLVIFSSDFSEVLLCKRKTEEDYDGVFSFPGGKLESSDASLERGIEREKNEELGDKCRVRVYMDYTSNVFFIKKSGIPMILPHYFCVFESGEIFLNEEYSEYAWVKIEDLESFEPKIPNVFEMVKKFLKDKEIITQLENSIRV